MREHEIVSPGATPPHPRDGNGADSRSYRSPPGAAPGWTPQAAWAAIAVDIGMIVGARSIVRSGGDPLSGCGRRTDCAQPGHGSGGDRLCEPPREAGVADFGLRRPPLARATGLVIAVLGSTVGVQRRLDGGTRDRRQRAGCDRSARRHVGHAERCCWSSCSWPSQLHWPRNSCSVATSSVLCASWRGFGLAAVTSSIVFATSHVGWVPTVVVVPAGVFGLGACLLYRWTDSLYPALAMHALSIRSVSLQRWGGPGSFRLRSGSRSPRPSRSPD